jgi:hypothetical protein
LLFHIQCKRLKLEHKENKESENACYCD